MTDQRERAIGSILGLAVGDALGAPFEFRRRSEIPDPLPAFELPWMGLPPGTWTDDTAMARNLWRSLADHDGALDLSDVLARHVAWLATGPPDVGNQTSLALREGAREVFERRGPEVSAGNGSVMYCAPLGVARAGEPGRLLEEAPALSRLTHWDGRCQTACLAVTLAAAALVRGDPAGEAVVEAIEAVPIGRAARSSSTSWGRPAGLARLDGPDQGFTLFTAGIALQVAGEGRDFEGGLRHVVGLGGDTDTNAAVAGALLGAAHGVDAIPAPWLGALADRDDLRTKLRRRRRFAACHGGCA